MISRDWRRILGAIAAMWLWCSHTTASAADLCTPSEATDPQALHINGSKPFVYKTVGGADLRLHVFRSAAHKPGDRSPAVVFFYGGGFLFGDIRRYQTQATHLALQGLVTVLVDYRVKCRHGSTIMDSVSDGKSAMRWVRGHADELGVDPSRIAVVGSSAGGLMAAATALVEGFNDPADAKIDPRPNALVLYNPALDMASPGLDRQIDHQLGKGRRRTRPRLLADGTSRSRPAAYDHLPG
jgi:acetyl esterase/lipase